MIKRVISLAICLVLACGIFACIPAFAAQDGMTVCFDKQFVASDWTGKVSSGSTNYITDAGWFSVVGSSSSTPYINSVADYNLNSGFELEVTSYINDQNLYEHTYSSIGIGDYSFIIRSHKNSGTKVNNYYVLEGSPANMYAGSESCSASSSMAFANLDSYIVGTASEYSYSSTVKVRITYVDNVLTFYANDVAVITLTESDVTAFDFSNVKVSFRLFHSWKVYADGAYFKGLKISRASSADLAISLIDDLPETITVADEESVVLARNCYNSLSASAQQNVSNYSDLLAAEVNLAQALIADIPAAISSNDGDKLDKAEAYFNSLAPDQKSSVLNYDVLVRAAGEFSVIGIIEQIEQFGDIDFQSAYAYQKLMSDFNALPAEKAAFVRNYNDLLGIGNQIEQLRLTISAQSVSDDIQALDAPVFTPKNTRAYEGQITDIDEDYIAAVDDIRAKITLLGSHDGIIGYYWFLDRELELQEAMLAFNDLAETKLRLAYYSYHEGVGLGEYCSFKESRPVYEGDSVHFMGFMSANGYTPGGVKFGNLYNIYYEHDGVTSANYQPVNGSCNLRNLEKGTYNVYHNGYSEYPAYLLFTFNVVKKPVYKYGLFDVAEKLDHTIGSYSDVLYTDKADVDAMWDLYDSMSVFDIDDVHNIRKLVDADKYFDDVEDGIITDDYVAIRNYCDFDGDGKLSASDLHVFRMYLVDLYQFDDQITPMANADRSSDGLATSADCLLLQQCVLGMLNALS